MANIIKKANKRLYFIVQLKRAKVPERDIITFYVTCVRPVLEYSCQAFHFALLAYLSDAIGQVQKHVLAIIYPNINNAVSLNLSGILKHVTNHSMTLLLHPITTLDICYQKDTAQDKILDKLESLSSQEQWLVYLRTPLYRFQLEFITNPDI